MMNTGEHRKTSGIKHEFDTSKVFNLNTKYPYYIKGEGDEFFGKFSPESFYDVHLNTQRLLW